jgi:hypothetical protein
MGGGKMSELGVYILFTGVVIFSIFTRLKIEGLRKRIERLEKDR